jgi:hypothetical protein
MLQDIRYLECISLDTSELSFLWKYRMFFAAGLPYDGYLHEQWGP